MISSRRLGDGRQAGLGLGQSFLFLSHLIAELFVRKEPHGELEAFGEAFYRSSSQT